MTQNIPPRTHGANSPRRPHDVRRDRALDLDRISSMSDEGGASGATMDLHEQLEHARAIASRPPLPTPGLIWSGPLAAVAAGLLTGMLLWHGRSSAAA